MRNTKKVISILLTLLMVVGMMSTFAFATSIDSGKGGAASITINNASKGVKYTVYQIFDAKVTGNPNGAITYQLMSGKETAPAGFTINNGTITRDAKGELTDTEKATLKEYGVKAAEATAEGDAITFTNLKYGYYYITSELGSVITVTNTNPNAEIYDKNNTRPDVPEDAKTVNETNVYIGQTVTYTLKFTTTNFDGEGEKAKRINTYVVHDTLPNYLSDTTVTSIKVKKGSTEQTLEVQQFDDNNKISIPWVKDGKSLYENGSTLEIIYTAKVNENISIAGQGNKNELTVSWIDEDNKTTTSEKKGIATIHTYAFVIQKVNEKGEALTGAEFNIPYKTTEVKNDAGEVIPGEYIVTDVGNSTVKVNDKGIVVVKGVKSQDSISITETKAPDGYTKPTDAITVKAEPLTTTTTSWTEYYKGDVLSYTEIEGAEHEEYTLSMGATVNKVVNTTGKALPSTGGIGTTIFYLIGAILVIGAGVVFVTRRRMHSEK